MNEQAALTTVTQTTALMPAMNMRQAQERYKAMNDFVTSILKEGTDFGVVPGTGDKPVLKKAGAEKLTTFFGLRPTFEVLSLVEDWIGEQHDGEPFFSYRYKCQLWHNGELVGEGIGSCNSWEKKYRYRNAQLICPECAGETIIKGKQEYGGGWVCWKAKGGCGSKWPDGTTAIEDQERGKVLNENPADLVNTIDKMAQKRALVAATLITTNASDYFTQDLDDLTESFIDAEFKEVSTGNGGNGQKPSETKPRANGGNVPTTGPNDLLADVDSEIDGSYGNIADLMLGIQSELGDGWKWPAANDADGWEEAKEAAIKHAAEAA